MLNCPLIWCPLIMYLRLTPPQSQPGGATANWSCVPIVPWVTPDREGSCHSPALVPSLGVKVRTPALLKASGTLGEFDSQLLNELTATWALLSPNPEDGQSYKNVHMYTSYTNTPIWVHVSTSRYNLPWQGYLYLRVSDKIQSVQLN